MPPTRPGTTRRCGSRSRPASPSPGRSRRTRAAARRVASTTRTPPLRALLTYWRHFLRRSPHSAASSARRSTWRVRGGWIGVRGPPAASPQRVAELAVDVGRAVQLDLGLDADVRDPAPARTRGPAASPPVKASSVAGVPLLEDRPARRVGERPREEPGLAKQQLDSEAGSRSSRLRLGVLALDGIGIASSSAIVEAGAIVEAAAPAGCDASAAGPAVPDGRAMFEPMNRSGRQPLGALTSAQALVWRYEPGFERATNASQAATPAPGPRRRRRGRSRRAASRRARVTTCVGIQLPPSARPAERDAPVQPRTCARALNQRAGFTRSIIRAGFRTKRPAPRAAFADELARGWDAVYAARSRAGETWV